MNKEPHKLLPVISDEAFEKAPIRDLIKALYFQVIQTQVLIQEVKTDTKNLQDIHDALSRLTYMKSGFFKMRYVHKTRVLKINPNFEIPFKDGTQETILLDLMFHKKSGKPKKVTWQCSELTANLRKAGFSFKKENSVYKAVLRIEDRIKREARIEGLIDVTKKRFKFVNTN